MSALDQHFEQFLRERTYVHNVTAKTHDWYQTAWHAFKQSQSHPLTEITTADLLAFVVHLRERGVKPVSCNTWLRAMNAFCRWLHDGTERLKAQRHDAETDAAVLRALTTTFQSARFIRERAGRKDEAVRESLSRLKVRGAVNGDQKKGWALAA